MSSYPSDPSKASVIPPDALYHGHEEKPATRFQHPQQQHLQHPQQQHNVQQHFIHDGVFNDSKVSQPESFV